MQGVQTQLDDHIAGVKAKDKKAANNIKAPASTARCFKSLIGSFVSQELKSALAKEAGQVKMLEAMLEESKDQLSGHKTLVFCSICNERMQDAQAEQRSLAGIGNK